MGSLLLEVVVGEVVGMCVAEVSSPTRARGWSK